MSPTKKLGICAERARRWFLWLQGCAITFGLAGVARAESAGSPAHPGTSVDRSKGDDAEGPRPKYGYWSEGTPRFFLSTKSEVGTPYVKPYLTVGYGLPHWIWVGIDANAILTTEMLQTYFGFRATSPILDLAIGARDTWSFQKPFLTPQNTYDRESVVEAAGRKARYWAAEVEALAVLPLPHAAIIGDIIAIKTLDVPDGRYVYDESYRAVIANKTFGVLRSAAVARLLAEDSLAVGVLGECVFSTGRSEPVYRLGPVGSLQLTDHLEIVGGLSMVVSSPDALGLRLGSYGVAGVRYRAATGEPRPKAPWQGYVIP